MSVQVEAAGRPALKRPPRALRPQQKRKRLSPGAGPPADPPPPPGLYVHSSPPRGNQPSRLFTPYTIRTKLRPSDTIMH
ncbi:hypothetical protein R5R35_000884 [Gryllus longicercus]|uniref:Uncharacterized protein n=1 Tax=Gryllus longicercus TaxID=2509291 RepID=A0AAN9VT59_9ORTH